MNDVISVIRVRLFKWNKIAVLPRRCDDINGLSETAANPLQNVYV